jgi:N-methylhydantoinase A/oxoprolinase/acetone carboxylase beta subunit
MQISNSTRYVIGLDVGGTNTDAVIVEYPSKEIQAAVKTHTTKDIFSGVTAALKQLFN